MKRIICLGLMILLVMLVAVSAFAANNKDVTKIALLINGNLGDKSFYDSADNGMELIKQKYGSKVITKTIEMSYDQTKWEPTLLDVSDQDWDLIIMGTWQMTEYLEKVAPDYPEKKYVIFDTSVDYNAADLANVYSIIYKQNEGSFLAGVLAGEVTISNMPLANPEKKVGILAGMDIPVVNDFLVGYIQGVQFVDKDIKVAISYVGNGYDSAKGKEMTLSQYNQGVDIAFNVAGQSGLGLLAAAKEANKYAIGVDSDQALLFKDSDPQKANHICTSMLKRIDNSLLITFDRYMDGTLHFGNAETFGIKEKCVGLADNEYYENIVSGKIRAKIKEAEKQILNGDIKVKSVYKMDNDELNKLRNSMK